MKFFKSGTIIIAFVIGFWLATPALAYPADNLTSELSGKILLDVDNKGEAWYVYPGDLHRYYLSTAEDAYNIMRNLSLGISNDNFSAVASSTPDKLKGFILLKTEDVGKAYYVNPSDKTLLYMPDAAAAFELMRQYSLGITNQDLQAIPKGEMVLDDLGQEVSRTWQYLGFWARVDENYTAVKAEPKNDAKKLGSLFAGNTVKVLERKKADGHIWYKIDGGRYPGGYINAAAVSAAPQPIPEKVAAVPAKVKAGDYWVDVSISKKVLTLYKYDQIVLATYISTGGRDTPTLPGTYNVWLKLKTTRMRGAPPIATHVYDLPNVPWVMYYRGSFAVHGTYWHDDFASQRSSGCTNVTQGDAKYIFDLTNPKMGGLDSVRSTASNPGMVVNNHY
ncbi:MAG TPA: L,D-transpeptidase family protein [bacterium]|nr:L,D-transpeptidase family protein [bacterium]HPT29686.1 L,D-transpeptidase family protein [bacterium]